VAVLPAGRRRAWLERQAAAIFNLDLAHRPLAFDELAAEAFGEVIGLRRLAGRPIEAVADLMIAAIARVHGATVVTRNTADFEHCGVQFVDPWSV